MIYIFYKYENNDRIIIFALSYIEAKETLYSLNSYADHIYNLTEYKMYDIDMSKYCDVLGIDANDYDFPKIISEKEFTKLSDSGAILDKQFKDIHNTKILTKEIADKFKLSNSYSLNEFKTKLDNNMKQLVKCKRNIFNMLYVVGDIWYASFYIKFNKKYYIVYGKSRYQCNELIQDLQQKYDNKFASYSPKLLIDNCNSFNSISETDIDNYQTMIKFMKENNIRKFPFTTYKEEES